MTEATYSTLGKSREQVESETKGLPICIIPARKGSKRLKHKNKLPIQGLPLVEHAIQVAKASNLFRKKDIIVSSDDEEILEIAYDYQVQVHLRPLALRTDRTQIKHVCKQILIARTTANVFCVLNPSCIGRQPEDLTEAYKLLFEKDGNYVMSVQPFYPQNALLKKGKYLKPISEEIIDRTQNKKKHWKHDGSVLFARTQIFFVEFNYGFYGSNIVPYFMPRPTVDIDTELDYKYAKALLEV